MKKTLYIVLAVAIAAGLTLIQAYIAGKASGDNEFSAYITAGNLKKGTLIEQVHLEEIVCRVGREEITPSDTDSSGLLGMMLLHDIGDGEFITSSDVCEASLHSGNDRYVALKVDGGNFNAGCFEKGDEVDIYFLPDYEKLENYQVVWLNEVLIGSSRFIKGKSPGILIENLVINHIEKTAGERAEYISIKVPKPVDQAMAFLEQISVYEFIGR